MKLVAIDIETTGINPKNCVPIQVGAAVFDLESPVFNTAAHYCKYIDQQTLKGELGGITINAEHLKKMQELSEKRKQYISGMKKFKMSSFSEVSDSKAECERYKNAEHKRLNELLHEFQYELTTPEEFLDDFDTWLGKYGRYSDANGKKHLNLCGKNIFKFDIPFLEAHFPDWGTRIRPHYRTIDPCALYALPSDDCPPNLFTCKTRAIIICDKHDKYSKYRSLFEQEVTHDALDDAIDVAKLIWFYYRLEEPVHKLTT